MGARNKRQLNSDDERLQRAAYLYFCEPDRPLQSIAEDVGIARETLWRWRQTEQWDKATAQMKRTWRDVAYRRLLFSTAHEAGSAGVTAAKEIIARIEGAVPQPILHGEAEGSDLAALLRSLKPESQRDLAEQSAKLRGDGKVEPEDVTEESPPTDVTHAAKRRIRFDATIIDRGKRKPDPIPEEASE